jgi:hypothetical protein
MAAKTLHTNTMPPMTRVLRAWLAALLVSAWGAYKLPSGFPMMDALPAESTCPEEQAPEPPAKESPAEGPLLVGYSSSRQPWVPVRTFLGHLKVGRAATRGAPSTHAAVVPDGEHSLRNGLGVPLRC